MVLEATSIRVRRGSFTPKGAHGILRTRRVISMSWKTSRPSRSVRLFAGIRCYCFYPREGWRPRTKSHPLFKCRPYYLHIDSPAFSLWSYWLAQIVQSLMDRWTGEMEWMDEYDGSDCCCPLLNIPPVACGCPNKFPAEDHRKSWCSPLFLLLFNYREVAVFSNFEGWTRGSVVLSDTQVRVDSDEQGSINECQA